VNFSTFLSNPVPRFARNYQGHGHMLFFQHIPKTAGSSLVTEMRAILNPFCNVHVPSKNYADHLKEGDPMAGAIEAFLAEHVRYRYRSASGHLLHSHMKTLREALPYVSFFTVLRDPVDRVISDYCYSLTEEYPLREQFMARFPTIDAYINCADYQNTMWNAVAAKDDAVTSDVIVRIFDSYLFIGLFDDITLHFEFLTALFGHPKTLVSHRNATKLSDSNRIEITDDLRDRIAAVNAKDMAFYRVLRHALVPRRSEIAAFVTARRAYYNNNSVEQVQDEQTALAGTIWRHMCGVPVSVGDEWEREEELAARQVAIWTIRRMERAGFSLTVPPYRTTRASGVASKGKT